MFRSLKFVAGIVAAACGIVAFSAAPAQAQAWPSKPIRVVLAFPGGSSTDVLIRVLAEPMQRSLGQTILVDPKPGAGAVIATQYVLNQPADGYTLMVTTPSQSLTSAKPNAPFDIRKDLVHIVQHAGGPYFIAVNTEKLPNVKTMKDFVEYARANPGKINFGSIGAGSAIHIGIELFNQVENIKTVHIPYKGSSSNVLALASGDSHAAMDVLTFLGPQHQAGKVRVLAATTAERSPMAPEYPGMRESGTPEYSFAFWQGFGGRTGLPKEIVARMNAVVNAALKDQAVLDYAKKSQTVLFGGTSEAITDIINKEVTTWAKLVKDANIALD